VVLGLKLKSGSKRTQTVNGCEEFPFRNGRKILAGPCIVARIRWPRWRQRWKVFSPGVLSRRWGILYLSNSSCEREFRCLGRRLRSGIRRGAWVFLDLVTSWTFSDPAAFQCRGLHESKRGCKRRHLQNGSKGHVEIHPNERDDNAYNELENAKGSLPRPAWRIQFLQSIAVTPKDFRGYTTRPPLPNHNQRADVLTTRSLENRFFNCSNHSSVTGTARLGLDFISSHRRSSSAFTSELSLSFSSSQAKISCS
jgi:hypothetical protein